MSRKNGLYNVVVLVKGKLHHYCHDNQQQWSMSDVRVLRTGVCRFILCFIVKLGLDSGADVNKKKKKVKKLLASTPCFKTCKVNRNLFFLNP